MATVAIWKYMDGYQVMMVAGGDLGRWESFVIDLDANVTQHLGQMHRDFMPTYSNVLVGTTCSTGPLPCLIKHAAMYRMNEALIQRVAAAAAEQPFDRLRDSYS